VPLLKSHGLGITYYELIIAALLFADDTALLADTFGDLQTLVDILAQYCETNRIEINIPKTKTMHFQSDFNSPSSSSSDRRIMINGQEIEEVKQFKYLGVWFSYDLKFDHMRTLCHKKASDRVSRELAHAIRNNLSNLTLITIWKQLIMCALEYCIGIWGNLVWRQAEALIFRAGKMILGLDNRKVTHAAVRGDLGLFSMKARVLQLRLRFYKKILMTPNNRLIYQVFCKEKEYYENKNIHKSPDKNWYASVAELTHLLQRTDLLNLSNIPDYNTRRIKASEIDPKLIVKDYSEREWQKEIKMYRKLDTYALIKTSLKCESYIEETCRSQTRTLSALRMSCHYLAMETGRWMKGVKREDRLCHFCPTRQVEDEMHALLHCVGYSDLREDAYQKITTVSQGTCNPWLWSNEFCFLFLMSGGYHPKKTKYHRDICKTIVSYVYKAFTRRKDLFARKGMDHAKYNILS
jgi:hypothetical protein